MKQPFALPGCTRVGHACQTVLSCAAYARLDRGHVRRMTRRVPAQQVRV